jgi:N-formylglutamate deformylase
MNATEIPEVMEFLQPRGRRRPLVFDSPHSGQIFPADFRPGIPLTACQRVCDWFVDDLFGSAPDYGAVMLKAHFRRAYIDPNRDTSDLDTEMIDGHWPDPVAPTEKARRGSALIWRKIDGRTAIYDRKLTVAEVRHRIETYWVPYHAALKRALDDAHATFGRVLHVNCHSMQAVGATRGGIPGQRRADFVIGTRDGTTAGGAFVDLVVTTLREAGYHVAIDERFKGVELIRRYADPANGRESLQIEVNRGLYMDEARIVRSDRYDRTKADISTMIARLAEMADRM